VATSIGIGIIGFGWMGQAHSRAYRDLPVYFPDSGLRPRLVAVADTVPERVELAQENFGFEHGTTDWHELIGRDDIEVVDITAPNALHRELVEAAAAAGKHIACEKPVGIDPPATAAIERAGRAAGVISGCGYNYRGDRHVGKQRVVLEDRVGVALVGRQIVDAPAFYAHLTGGQRYEATDQVERRGLAAAGRTEQAEELARLDPQRNPSRATASP
jgi:predicted dehydrogenase